MKHVRQPEGSKVCGHCCIAMVCEISLEAAIARVGHQRAMRNREVIAALADCANTPKAVVASRYKAMLPEPSIIRMR
ncbi:MAG: hypothetical protein ACRC4O_01875, partial [Giesbergeria sp.]